MVKYYLWFEMLLRELLNRNERHVQGRLRADIIALVATTRTVLLHRETYFPQILFIFNIEAGLKSN